MNSKSPKLKGVQKYKPDYALGKFPKGFALALGKELIYLLATREPPTLEGSDWERIFARCVGAKWTPSNVGLDDVQMHQMAWSAKTVKNKSPFKVKHVRLISGRNSPDYSFDVENVQKCMNASIADKQYQLTKLRNEISNETDNSVQKIKELLLQMIIWLK